MRGAPFRAKFPGVAANAAAAPGDHIHDRNSSFVAHFPFPISSTTYSLLCTLFFSTLISCQLSSLLKRETLVSLHVLEKSAIVIHPVIRLLYA